MVKKSVEASRGGVLRPTNNFSVLRLKIKNVVCLDPLESSLIIVVLYANSKGNVNFNGLIAFFIIRSSCNHHYFPHW